MTTRKAAVSIILPTGGTVNGTFENASAQLLTFGFTYKL